MKGVAGILLPGILWSCSSETPFETDGEGIVRLRTVVNSITTRADDSENDAQQQLSDNCIVYISGTKGLIYKKQGLSNVDPQITLKAGSYVAEAWTGDSVTASFDKKFYRGYQPFEVTGGSSSNVVLNCKIRNVVASINTATIDPNLMRDDYKVTIKNSGKDGALVFNKENAETAKGYFMMPNGDTSLEYLIEGTRKDGKPFSKSGKIENVQSAHHYILNFEYNPGGSGDPETGGVFINIIIKDENLVENDQVDVHTRPTVTGIEFDIDKQLNYIDSANIPDETKVQICSFGELDEIVVSSETGNLPGLSYPNVNVLKLDERQENECNAAGLKWSRGTLNEKNNVETAWVSLSKSMIEQLPTASTTEHRINITAKDLVGKTTTKTLRIVRNEEAIILEDPIVVEDVSQSNDNLAIGAHSFTLTFTLADEYTGTPGIEYSKANEDNWTFVAASLPSGKPKYGRTRATTKYKMTINGLEAGTAYKYRACCGDYRSTDIMTFTTESKYIIPYADMEIWNAFTIAGVDNCKLPGTAADEFWGNGNPGSMKMSVSLTQESEDMKKSGKYSAKLRSQFVGLGGIAGKFAAGNLFAGTYVETQGTDGHLKFGRPYNGSHPKALKVWVNYRPGTVEKTASEAPEIVKGGLDIGQIYVALTTQPIEIFTKKSNRKLFNKDDAEVLAYGQYTFDKVNYGPDGQLQELVIPIEYYEKAKTQTSTHIVIVCSASKFGDYFCGGEGSTMYLDDFELIYE